MPTLFGPKIRDISESGFGENYVMKALCSKPINPLEIVDRQF